MPTQCVMKIGALQRQPVRIDCFALQAAGGIIVVAGRRAASVTAFDTLAGTVMEVAGPDVAIAGFPDQPAVMVIFEPGFQPAPVEVPDLLAMAVAGRHLAAQSAGPFDEDGTGGGVVPGGADPACRIDMGNLAAECVMSPLLLAIRIVMGNPPAQPVILVPVGLLTGIEIGDALAEGIVTVPGKAVQPVRIGTGRGQPPAQVVVMVGVEPASLLLRITLPAQFTKGVVVAKGVMPQSVASHLPLGMRAVAEADGAVIHR